MITSNFSSREARLLKKLYFFFILSLLTLYGCAGAMRPGVQSSSPNSYLDARLASLSIPDPIESPASPAAIPAEALPGIKDAVSLDPLLDFSPWVSWAEPALLTLAPIEDREKIEPAGDSLWEKTPIGFSELGKNAPSARKRSPLPLRTAKAIIRKESSSSESSLRREDDMQSLENITEAITPEVSSSTHPDLQEAQNRLTDPSLPLEGAVSTPSSAEGGSIEPSPSDARPSTLNPRVSRFPSLLNEKVNDFIAFFQGKADAFFSRSLARSQAYEEMMKKIFREKNLPEELFYLALIESGYNPTALSRAKASGIWQFVAQTAKRFGLRVDKWVDERRDPEKSTYAAAEYLKTLYGMFNNWDLATAGYNAGEAKVLKAMQIAQSDDFWEISKRRYLKEETKKYVPMFLAAVTIAQEPQKYGFANIDYHPPLVYEKVLVPPSTSLTLVAKASETDFSEIRALNPALIREKTPPTLPKFEIKLPPGKKVIFEKNFSRLSQASANKKVYRVRSGDSLARIAKKYHVSVQDICTVNDLSSQALLKQGSILKIP